MKDFLHVGCGQKRKDRTTPGFNTPQWRELRFDINPKVKPDIVGTMTDMSAVADASVDAIYSSHNIEHLYPHEIPHALAEFKRVLHWSAETDGAIEERVASILADVQQRGDAAVLEYTQRCDGLQADSVAALEITQAELQAALSAITSEQRQALHAAAERVRDYH